MVFTIKTNVDRWLAKYEKSVKRFERRTSLTPLQVAEWGAKKGKLIAPRDTGSLISAIGFRRVGSQKRGSGKALVKVNNVTNPKYYGKRGRVPRYAAIHHKSPGGASWMPKKGDPHWLITVRKEAKRRFKKQILGHIQKFL